MLASLQVTMGLEDALRPHGMRLRGGFVPVPGDLVPGDLVPDVAPGRAARTLLLIGNIGGGMWQPFAASDARMRHADHPMDRWTAEMLDPIAAHFGARALYPSDGPPYHPFQRWAARAEPVAVSPLRIFIHPTYGLWHAYRAAFVFGEEIALTPPAALPSPCPTCAGQPCLSTCPVGAFTRDGFDDKSCARHVDGPNGAECRDNGCLARRACPVGPDFAYPPAQMAFHMEAFLAPRR